MIAEVIINSTAKKLNRTFDYSIPNELKDYIVIGSTVLVPFGNFKELEEAYVVGFKEKSLYKTKEIVKIKDNLTNRQIELAKWMAKRYFCNISECVKLMISPGMRNAKGNTIQDKKINAIYLNKDYEQIKFDIETGIIKSEKHKKLLEFLNENGGCTVSEIEMFTGCSRAIVNTLIKNGYLMVKEIKIERNPLINKNIERDKKLKLTDEQQIAFSKVEQAIESNRYEQFLLYGVTGAGKTEVYLQLIEKSLEKNKNSIVLVPEISLTPQMIDRFIARFGKEVIAVLHSKLSTGEKYDEWNNIKEGKAKIIIGARSAIFAPVQNIGIIIIDEEHDPSYKSEMSPRYNAKEIAEILAKENKCPLILGSATPDITTYYKAKQNKITMLRLQKRANNSKLPTVKIIDLKQELINGNKSMISIDLYKSMLDNLTNKRQTILFLNRRGFSTFIMCRECGYTIKCKNCNISMTYHSFDNKLKCHYCGYEENVVKICPNCKSSKIRYFGTGTQKLEEEVHKIFPTAKTIRMDVDTVTKKNSHEDILNCFKNDGIDILIGTQMVVKGHHFPNVTLVGVIAADSSLNIDDYRANERTFQILTQVAGRAGRGNLDGRVIIQTYNPEHFILDYAKKQDYDLFYNTEIALRKQLKYPPFCDIIIINFDSIKEEELKKTADFVYKYIIKELDGNEFKIFKPLPAPIDKIQNRIRWRMIIKGNMNENANSVFNKCLQDVYKLNLRFTRVAVNINPNNMM